ncbi:MAG: geranylgeranyl reductase family protein [Bacteroidales bacterium]|jgi:geranylgeranyl reductase family protein|nr:geranylgeranyl reductase family protein [Bacteroidales bacterium]
MNNYDIIIIGAGPAGCSAALTLQHSNKRIALFDKETFPREKICGDGICDRSINTLNSISEDYYTEFIEQFKPHPIQKTSLVYKGKHHILNFKNFGYTCKRKDFDAFLFGLVKRDCSEIDIYEKTAISTIKKVDSKINISTADGDTYSAKMVIIANGAKSKLAAELQNTAWEKSSNGVAVRAYFSGVSDVQDDMIELHYKKEFFPGYFWIFPIEKNICNVGFGYHLKQADKHLFSIQDIFNLWIETDSQLKQRFQHAKMESKLQGGLIPYNSNNFDCAGDNYMITGDAASLIDPISGGGIGSAMYSGHTAAQTAEACINDLDCSYNSTQQYESQLKARIQQEIKIRHRIQKVISHMPFTLDVCAALAKNQKLLDRISSWYLR